MMGRRWPMVLFILTTVCLLSVALAPMQAASEATGSGYGSGAGLPGEAASVDGLPSVLFKNDALTIAGTLRSADGAPVGGKTLGISLGGIRQGIATTDDAGRFSFSQTIGRGDRLGYGRLSIDDIGPGGSTVYSGQIFIVPYDMSLTLLAMALLIIFIVEAGVVALSSTRRRVRRLEKPGDSIIMPEALQVEMAGFPVPFNTMAAQPSAKEKPPALPMPEIKKAADHITTSPDKESSRQPMARYGWSAKPLAIGLTFIGALALAAWYLMNNGSTASLLLLLAGIGIVLLAFMLYFIIPGKYLAIGAADAMALSNTLNVSRMLSALPIKSGGIYLPENEEGVIRVFVPVLPTEAAGIGKSPSVSELTGIPGAGGKGLLLVPPGQGLFKYAQGFGAAFTEKSLGREIKDILENGLGLASSVTVHREGDRITVTMHGLADAEMCATIRREDPRVCDRTGCPICSLVGCMVVSGIGRKARIDKAGMADKAVAVTFELL